MQQATYKIITIASPESDPLQRNSTSTTGSRNTASGRNSSDASEGFRRALALASAAAQQQGPGTVPAADASKPQLDTSGSAEISGSEQFDSRFAHTYTLQDPLNIQHPA